MDFTFQYFNPGNSFQEDDRNANFLPNIFQMSSVFLSFTFTFYFFQIISHYLLILTKNLKLKFTNKGLLYIINYFINSSIKIQRKKYIMQFSYVFSALIYEYCIFTILALKHSDRSLEGTIGFCIALIGFYFVLFRLIMMISYKTHLKNPLVSETNKYIYLCTYKVCFVTSIVFFHNCSIISIFFNLINELIICYSILQFKIYDNKSESVKKFIHHKILLFIFLMYTINEFYRNNAEVLILIAWIIIALMGITLVQTTAIDFLKLIFPIIEKFVRKLQLQQKKTSNEVMSTINVSKEVILRQLI